MLETALHRRITLAVVVVLSAAVACAPASAASVTGTPLIDEASSIELPLSSTPANQSEAAENVTASFTHEGEQLVLQSAENQNVTLRTNADPGTKFEVELWSNETLRLLTEAVTSDDGSATATFDLQQLEPGTEIRVVARYEDRKVGETSGVVQEFSANVVTKGDRLVLRRGENQTVRVRTDAPPGRELTAYVKSEMFLRKATATVSDDGTATATFDLSEASNATHVTVSVGQSQIKGWLVNESATVKRDGTLTVSEPTSSYEIRGHVDDPFVTRLDVRISNPDASFSTSRTVDVGEDGTFTAAFDLSSLPAGADVSVEVGGVPRSVDELVVTEESGAPTAYVLVEPANATIRYPGETLLVHPESDQTVRGTTNLRPGTELTVTAENDRLNSPNAFERTTNVTVLADGTFVAELNFTGVEPGTNFSVSVGPRLARMDGRVVNESVTLPTVTTTEPTTQPTTDESAFATESTTTDGGADDNVDFVPGFGVPVTLIALLAAIVLARRTRT